MLLLIPDWNNAVPRTPIPGPYTRLNSLVLPYRIFVGHSMSPLSDWGGRTTLIILTQGWL
jgi:hypothetical protein